MADYYQQIGQQALTVVGGSVQKLLLYAEVEDGVISADIFYQPPKDNVVHFRFAPEALRNVINEFWERGAVKIKPRSWAALRFIVGSDGRFTTDLTYPDQFNAKEVLSDRRPRVVAEIFPGSKVNYSKPRG